MPDPLPWDQFTNNALVTKDSPDPVVIIGAGLAGCWMARTLAEAGIRVTMLDKAPYAAGGASSNPAGIVKPFVTRAPCLAMSFYVAAHRYLREQLLAWDLVDVCGFTDCGVAQLVDKPYPTSAHYTNLAPSEMQDALGVQSNGHAIHFEGAGWLNPAALCSALLEHELISLQCECVMTTMSCTQTTPVRWQIDLEHKPAITASHVVICTGTSLPDIPISCSLPVTPARGQISRFKLESESPLLRTVISGKHYVIPDGRTVLVGATFSRGNSFAGVVTKDNIANASGLGETLPALNIQPTAVEAYAGVRATTPDRLPLVGPLPDAKRCAAAYADLKHGRNYHAYPTLPVHASAYVLGGLGSRGIVTAPFAARLLVDFMLGGYSINAWSPLINPARFQIRDLKRGKFKP